MSSNLPNFLIAGVARCGTTSLYYYLKQHPDIGFPDTKEPKYFSSQHIDFPQKGIGDRTVDEKMVTNFDDYQKLFQNLGEYDFVGEASSDYFYYSKYTIPKIKNTLGDVPIIISIRNPVERSYSAYNNLIRDGRENLSFSDAIGKEQGRIKNGWDWMWYYKRGSLYAEGIEAFQDHFSNVKILIFEDFKDPIQMLHSITDFLGVSRFEQYDVNTKYSPSGEAKNPIIKTLSSRKIPFINYIRNKLLDLFGRQRAENLAKNFFVKDELSKEVKIELSNYFMDDIKKTEKLINRDLQSWLI